MDFETERLLMKPMGKNDENFILKLLETQVWVKSIKDRNIKSVSDAKDYIKDKMPNNLKYSSNVIIHKETNTRIGACSYYYEDGSPKKPYIYCALLAPYEDHGYTYESIKQLIKVAELEFDIKKFKAHLP